MRALVVALLLPGAALGQDRCLLGCDQLSAGAEARNAATALLRDPLPGSAEVVGVVAGGFQDAFVQIRIDMPDTPAMDTVLGALGTSFARLEKAGAGSFGPTGPAWWDVDERGLLRTGPATLEGFAHATVGVAPAAEGWVSIFVWAFQT